MSKTYVVTLPTVTIDLEPTRAFQAKFAKRMLEKKAEGQADVSEEEVIGDIIAFNLTLIWPKNIGITPLEFNDYEIEVEKIVEEQPKIAEAPKKGKSKRKPSSKRK